MLCFQLRCCGVHRDGWDVFRETEWFKMFGARDGENMKQYTYGRGCDVVACHVLMCNLVAACRTHTLGTDMLDFLTLCFGYQPR